MALYASQLHIDFPQMYLLSKFEDSINRGGFLETERNATGECFAFAYKSARGHTRRVLH